MIQLSVNVNKIATLRNSRGADEPSVLRAVHTCLDAGAPGITVHPRADERHIRLVDLEGISDLLKRREQAGSPRAEYNVEGDPRPDLMARVLRLRPDQCTLVPVMPGEITSQAGWSAQESHDQLRPVIGRLRSAGIRVSLFIDPEPESIRWAAALEADRVELYTKPFALAFTRGESEGRASFRLYQEAATLAHELGMGVNAGHDLDLQNLVLFRTLPHLLEVSIGHALVSHAVWVGLSQSVRSYLDVLREPAPDGR